MCVYDGRGDISVRPGEIRAQSSCVLETELSLQLTMEAVISRLRDFSCRETSFEDCEKRDAGRLDIETALAWLRRELMEMRSQDQALIRQLMDLHEGIQELKLECVKAIEEDEDEDEVCWDSASEAGGSSVSSCSGEMSFYPSISSFSTWMSPPPLVPLPRRAFSRRSSVP